MTAGVGGAQSVRADVISAARYPPQPALVIPLQVPALVATVPYDFAARGRARKSREVALNASARGPGLDRYVLPVDEMAVLDGEGFLDAQSVHRWPTGATDRPQSVTELADQPGSFVLLAADGAGKTRVLESLRA